MKTSSEKFNTKEKRPWERVLYNILIWCVPVLYLNIFPWIIMVIKNLLLVNNPNPFEGNYIWSNLLFQLGTIIVPGIFNFIVGSGILFLGLKMKENTNTITFLGSMINCIYALFIIIGTIGIFAPRFSFGLGEYSFDRAILILGAYAFLFILNLKKK